MINTVEKMKEDVNRCNGYYLMKTQEDSELLIGFVHWEGDSVEITGDNYRYRTSRFHWIADEPLDLEQLLTNYNYSVDLNKRLGDAIGHVKGLSKEEFAQDIFDAGYVGPIVVM